MNQRDKKSKGEPRWPALVAILATGLVYGVLPKSLSFGPRWLLAVVVSVLEVPTMAAHYRGQKTLNRWLGFLVSAILTSFLMGSLVLLVFYLPEHREQPVQMLRSATALWIATVMVFALWYWRLDAGGPTQRDMACAHTKGAFLFPQMLLESERGKWSPRFVDYLFLAFCTSTAFSPTDVPILSRWAKVLVMIQAGISLTTVVILAARAVNIM